MPITRARKEETVALLAERFAACESAVLIDYRGLTVAEMRSIRAQLREAGCDLQVAMNRLIKLALDQCGMSTVGPDGVDRYDDLLRGPTAVIFGYEQPSAAGEIALKLAQTYEVVSIKGGFYGTLPLVGEEAATKIATMRSKVDALADLIRIINPTSALRRVVTVAKGGPSRVIAVAGGLPRRLMSLKHVLEQQSDAA